jgi:hypothetical protein
MSMNSTKCFRHTLEIRDRETESSALVRVVSQCLKCPVAQMCFDAVIWHLVAVLKEQTTGKTKGKVLW